MTPALETARAARLNARFRSTGGQTRMSECLSNAPLKIAKTFLLEQGIGVCVMDSSPGLLAGDCYEFGWYLGERAHVAITTQGFTRVHPSRENPCRLKQQVRLERGAVLEWFPEPLMLYRDAALQVETDIELGENATLAMGETVCAGRVGRGEAFEFHAYQNRLRVRRDGRLIFVSQTALRPFQFAPNRVGAWAGFTHQGQFLLFSPRAKGALLDEIRAVLVENPAVWSGASLLESGDIAISMLGHRAFDLQALMAQLRACVTAQL